MERKCAIYNFYSINDKERLESNREELIKYCVEQLKIKDYEVFEDVGSMLNERKDFNRMIEQIHNKNFTDLLVKHPNRIFRAEYDKKKFDDIVTDIDKPGVLMHSIINFLPEKDKNDISKRIKAGRMR